MAEPDTDPDIDPDVVDLEEDMEEAADAENDASASDAVAVEADAVDADADTALDPLDGVPTLEQAKRMVEALVFVSSTPVSERALIERLGPHVDLAAVMTALAEDYAPRGVVLAQVGKSWAFRTAEDLAPMMTEEKDVQKKFSRAAVETLAIIAYHQPVTRAEVEEIRGVALSKGTLDGLLEAGWITPRGRRQTPGRPLTWGTTERFLDHFGLGSVKDLPGMAELKAAGLLDTRPGLTAYRSRAEDEEGALPFDTEDEATDEPLDTSADGPDWDESELFADPGPQQQESGAEDAMEPEDFGSGEAFENTDPESPGSESTDPEDVRE